MRKRLSVLYGIKRRLHNRLQNHNMTISSSHTSIFSKRLRNLQPNCAAMRAPGNGNLNAVWAAAVYLALAAHLAKLTFAIEHQDNAAAVTRCFETHNCLSADRTTWEYLIDDLPSCQAAARVWWSSKPPGVPVTLVTQLSVARLHQLQAQCATWRGPLAAAIFLPLINPERELSPNSSEMLQDAIESVDKLFRASEANTTGSCHLRMVLMYELFADARAASTLYPVNTLRNYARLMADTDLVTNIDVDLLPSLSISTVMSDPAALANYTAGARAGNVYIWPAFQTNCKGPEYTDSIALGGKNVLQQALNESVVDECVTTFEYKYPQFHGPTQYDRWYGNRDTAYQIKYQFSYEPWYLGWRWSMPWFDFRYRGYGYNKCVQTAAMNSTGVTWLVSPHGFVIHRPHEQTSMRKSFVHVKINKKEIIGFRNTMYGHVQELWDAAQADLSRFGRLEVRVEDSFRLCQHQLPWWRTPQPASPPPPPPTGLSGGGSHGYRRRLLR